MNPLEKIMGEILQEIRLFTTYLRLREGDDIKIEFNVEYSQGDYLGLTKIDENGRRAIVLNLDRDELRTGRLDRDELRTGRRLESKIRGIILHEEAHNLFTPMSSTKELHDLLMHLSKEFPKLNPKVIEYVVNLVEDYRVEYLFKKEYPGSVRNFSDIYTAVLDKFAEQYNPNSILHLLFLARMATTTKREKTSGFEQMIPSRLKNMYYKFIKDIEETTGKEFNSTGRAARRILKEVNKYVEEDKSNNSETELNDLERLPKLFGGYVSGRISTSNNLPSYIEEALNEAKKWQNSQLNKNLKLAESLKFAKRAGSELRSQELELKVEQVHGYYSYELRKTLEYHYGGSHIETTDSMLGGRLNERKIMDRLVRREPLVGPGVQLYEIRRSSIRGTDLFVLVDTSDSMAEDLEKVEEVLSALVETTRGSTSITTRFFGFPGAEKYLYDIKPDEVKSLTMGGGTPLANALEELEGEMKRVVSFNPDKNHILFILTDGRSDDPEMTNAQLRRMKETGIEVITILTTGPRETAKEAFAESRVVYLKSDQGREISIGSFFKELSKELSEAAMDKKFGKQKIY